MTQEEKFKISSNDYVDLFVIYNRNQRLLQKYPDTTTHIINTRYAVAYLPANQLTNTFIQQNGYSPIPRIYGLTSEISLEASGVEKLRRLPSFGLRGKGVLIGIIDTGIDYTNPIFIREDNTTKIVSIWDQTIDSKEKYPYETFFGTEYTAEDINQALKSDNPYSIVPSIDEDGHGTMLAGVAAGREVPKSAFSGVVPDSDLIVVKLKEAKKVLKDFFLIPPNVKSYQENDIAWALDYMVKIARKLKRPLAICIGLGSTQGAHDGRGTLDNTVNFYADFPGFTISVSAGNEGNAGKHFYSTVDPAIGYSAIDLIVGENEYGFSMEIWGTPPNTYSVDLYSPTGEHIPRMTESIRNNQEIRFIFERTTIQIDYQLVETHTGNQLILMRFTNPTPGNWRFRVFSRGDLEGSFHIWLPMNNFISQKTFFSQADPYTTITSPGNSLAPITVTAYNPSNKALYLKASKGYTRTGVIKPELAAPGDSILVPTLKKDFQMASGTGIAAAHTAGITAMLLEWGIVKGNYPGIDSVDIKKYLIRGAIRDKTNQYPNRDWGYGRIDLYNSFDVLRQDFKVGYESK